jgi:hypothetical protein
MKDGANNIATWRLFTTESRFKQIKVQTTTVSESKPIFCFMFELSAALAPIIAKRPNRSCVAPAASSPFLLPSLRWLPSSCSCCSCTAISSNVELLPPMHSRQRNFLCNLGRPAPPSALAACSA